MDQRPPKHIPSRDQADPFRKPLTPPDEREDQADSGPDRENPITRDSKRPASPQQPR